MKTRRLNAVFDLLLLLITGTGWRTAPPLPPPTSYTAAPISVATQDYIVQSSAVAADFNGNGYKEIVIGGVDGYLYVVAYDGASWSMAWSRQTAIDLNAAGAPSTCTTTDKSDIRSSAAIGDLNNDGRLEIVVATGGSPAYHRNGGVLVYTFNSDSPWSFSAVPGWPQPNTDDLGSGSGMRNPDGCWDGIEGSPALGDLTGDGNLEVVISSLNRRIYAWHHNGALVDGWPIYRYNGDALLRGGLSSPALGDLDGDGLVEVVVGTNSPPWGGEGSPAPDYSKATVWAINGDSTNVPGWPVETKNNIYSSPALGDIDGDGHLEVVVGSGPSVEGGDGKWVYAWNHDGTPVNGWPKPTAGDVVAPPALGDLDGDGLPDVVIGCGREFETSPASCTSLYAWRGNGTAIPGFPMTPGNFTQPYSPILVDYDGDGQLEILVLKQDQPGPWGVAVVEHNGVLSSDDTIQVQSFLYNAPLVEDLDSDGKLEAVMGGFAIYIWDLATSAGVSRPWPMFHHDAHRTGNVAFNLDTTPPQNPTVSSPSHTAALWSNDDTVQVNWSGASDDESGIAGYYYAWNTSATTSLGKGAAWADAAVSSLQRTLSDGANWYFHIRAVNGAGLLAEDTVHFGPVKIDTVPPVSQASAPACAVLSAAVSWRGSDGSSGLDSYNVQVRAGSSGPWTTWQSGTTAASGVYGGATGPIYQFRSLARDVAGNVETKGEDVFDAQTWLTQYGFSGTVYTVREQPVFMAHVTATPLTSLSAATDPQGNYLLCHEESTTYALDVSRSGFGPLPPMRHLMGTLSDLDFYLPPLDDGVQNGQFEEGSLNGWSASGSGTVIVTDTAHTGDYAAELSGRGTAAWQAAISQTVAVSEMVTEPTLSWMYRLGGGGSAWVWVEGQAHGLSLPLTPSLDWSHAWVDLSAFQGQDVEIAFHLAGAAGESGQLLVDEVSLGTPGRGAERIFLPLLLRQA